MKMKEGLGWKACYNEKENKYGAEVMFQGSWDLYEITADVFNSLNEKMNSSTAEELISQGRHLYIHSNDNLGPSYNVVLDEDYALYCPWMASSTPVGKTWDENLTDAAVEVLESEKANRPQRRKKRQQRTKKASGKSRTKKSNDKKA